MKLLRPVALCTGFIGGTHVSKRRTDGFVVSVEGDCIKLVHSIKLGTQIPLGSPAYMALDTTDARMGRSIISDEFRLHHKMALLTTKSYGFRVFKRSVASESTDKKKYEAKAKKNKKCS